MLKEFTDAYEGLEVRVDAATWGERHRSTSDASVLLLAEKPGDCVAVELFPLNLIPACSQALAASFDFSDEVALANET